MRRRSLLKKFGGSVTALALATQSTVATDSEPVRTIDLDVSAFEYLDEAVVRLFADERKNVQMVGTRPETPTDAAGYGVALSGLRSESGRWTPAQARAEVSVLPASELVRKNESGTSSNELSGSGSSGTSGVGTQSHDGSDSESDYEGGIWTRSEDPIDLNLAITEGWIDWTTSGGEVDYVQWKWHAVACETCCTTWYIEDAGHSYSDFSGSDVDVKFYGDYYNYNYGDDNERTEAHHRLWTSGNPDGSMNWWTDHWHNGESSGNLRTDAGWFSNYDEHTGHC